MTGIAYKDSVIIADMGYYGKYKFLTKDIITHIADNISDLMGAICLKLGTDNVEQV